jgi:hypothetical protein
VRWAPEVPWQEKNHHLDTKRQASYNEVENYFGVPINLSSFLKARSFHLQCHHFFGLLGLICPGVSKHIKAMSFGFTVKSHIDRKVITLSFARLFFTITMAALQRVF